MKRILPYFAGLVLGVGLVLAFLARAGAWDIALYQFDQDGTGTIQRVLVRPPANGNGLLGFNGSTAQPGMMTVDSTLTLSGTTLGVNTLALPAASFGFPSAKTTAVSTSYQAADPSKPAIIYPSFACTNATQVLASSECSIQVRVHTSAVTCSTGTIYYTQRLAVNLGVLITQNSTNPVPVFLPATGHMIFCPVAGTFTITTVEQAIG